LQLHLPWHSRPKRSARFAVPNVQDHPFLVDVSAFKKHK